MGAAASGGLVVVVLMAVPLECGRGRTMLVARWPMAGVDAAVDLADL